MAIFSRSAPKKSAQPKPSLQSCAAATSADSKSPAMIAIASGKGGVGKSTLARNLAASMIESGLRVGIIDADIYGPTQCNLLADGTNTKCGIDEQGWILPLQQDGLYIVSVAALMSDESAVIWRAPMATRLIGDFLTRVKWPELDYILVDLPPGTGDIQITLSQQARLTGVIVVTTPQKVAYKVAEKALAMFNKVHVPILGVVENMSGFICSHCGEASALYPSGGGELLAENYQTKLLVKIPLDETLLALAEAGNSITAAPADNKARQAYTALAKMLPERLQLAENPDEPTSIEVDDQQRLQLQWPDGDTAALPAMQLRLACACATCKDETTGQPLLDKATIPADVGIKAIQPIGRYGYQINFSDGHGTGIYTFEVLRALRLAEFSPPVRSAVSSEQESEKANSEEPGSKETGGPSLDEVRHVIDTVLNPQVAQHGGRIVIHEISGNTVRLEMTGGCQGCSQSTVTLEQAVTKLLRQHFPSLTEFVDITRHSEGKQPYYASNSSESA